MKDEKEFYQVKIRAIKALEVYKKTIQNTDLSDLNEVATRLPLLEAYIEMVKANADLTLFINELKKEKYGWSW